MLEKAATSSTTQQRIFERALVTSPLPPIATELLHCDEPPVWAMCGRLRVGKDNLHVAGLVGAAMCSAFECGSHDRWP